MVEALIMGAGYTAERFHGQAKTQAGQRVWLRN
jgi:hypothetical protein